MPSYRPRRASAQPDRGVVRDQTMSAQPDRGVVRDQTMSQPIPGRLRRRTSNLWSPYFESHPLSSLFVGPFLWPRPDRRHHPVNSAALFMPFNIADPSAPPPGLRAATHDSLRRQAAELGECQPFRNPPCTAARASGRIPQTLANERGSANGRSKISKTWTFIRA
jgi:hypothetical protein